MYPEQPRRSPYGERGLKCIASGGVAQCHGRSPYGERGLKYMRSARVPVVSAVALLTESVD